MIYSPLCAQIVQRDVFSRAEFYSGAGAVRAERPHPLTQLCNTNTHLLKKAGENLARHSPAPQPLRGRLRNVGGAILNASLRDPNIWQQRGLRRWQSSASESPEFSTSLWVAGDAIPCRIKCTPLLLLRHPAL